jgi:hypothetical protein
MNIGVILNDLTASQLSYFVVKNFNDYLDKHPKSHIICFYQEISQHSLPANFACMEISEIWGFEGPIIATTFESAEKLLGCATCPRPVFYLWDLEWLRTERDFASWRKVFADERMDIIVRSQSHKQIFEECWNRKVLGIVDNFNLQEIQDLLRTKNG